MALPFYLAMTAAEMQANSELPEHLGYMACHFSPYGSGLSNLPADLPPGSMLILNDRIPCYGHDQQLITNQLLEAVEHFGCSCVLLDFQRTGCEENAQLAKRLSEVLPCPAGISELYAETIDCAVFLPPLPLDVPLAEYLAPWQGREIWLDAALDGVAITLTEAGCTYVPLPYPQLSGGFTDEALHCHYQMETVHDAARFQLYRTVEDLTELLKKAENLGVNQAIGLWQELGHQ